MGEYINNTSRLCVAPMPEADVFAKEHFAEGFPCAKNTADAFKRLQDDLYAQGLITMEELKRLNELIDECAQDHEEEKTMAEYIDRKKTVELLKSLGNREYRREKGTIQDAIKMISYPEYTPTEDVAPIEALEHLRDELCAQDLITLEGLRKLNTLIWKYTTAHDGG